MTGTPLRMFVVEDSTDILDGLVLVLATRSIEVVGTARSAEEAIDWLGEHPDGCDAAIVDYFLRTGSGVDVLRYLQESGSSIERVVLTNYATNTIRTQCEQAGATSVFDKSFQFDDMLAWFDRFQAAARK